MLEINNSYNPEIEMIVRQIRDRAEQLYLSRKMLCAEAVLVSMNEVLDGGLEESQAISMAAPFSIAMGESGCLCGAVSGAVLASGLFLGSKGLVNRTKPLRNGGRRLHDEFRAAHGSTCCRILTKKVKHDSRLHFKNCTRLTADAAEMVARLVLSKRPDLVFKAGKTIVLEKKGTLKKAFSTLLNPFLFFR